MLSAMISFGFDCLEMLIERCPRPSQASLVDFGIDPFVSGNLPISQINTPFFRKFVSQIKLAITETRWAIDL
jgi:hypothetical protein